MNVYRPGGVDTAIQAYIRGQDPAEIGAALDQRFVRLRVDDLHSAVAAAFPPA